MSVYSTNFVIPANYEAATYPIFDLRSGATDIPLLMEISGIIANGSALNISLGFGRNATMGAVKTNAIGWVSEDIADNPSPNVTVGIDWTTRPTAPTSYLRRWTLTTSNFNHPLFRFPAGLKLLPSSSLGLWLLATNGTGSSPLTGAAISLVIDA